MSHAPVLLSRGVSMGRGERDAFQGTVAIGAIEDKNMQAANRALAATGLAENQPLYAISAETKDQEIADTEIALMVEGDKTKNDGPNSFARVVTALNGLNPRIPSRVTVDAELQLAVLYSKMRPLGTVQAEQQGRAPGNGLAVAISGLRPHHHADKDMAPGELVEVQLPDPANPYNRIKAKKSGGGEKILPLILPVDTDNHARLALRHIRLHLDDPERYALAMNPAARVTKSWTAAADEMINFAILCYIVIAEQVEHDGALADTVETLGVPTSTSELDAVPASHKLRQKLGLARVLGVVSEDSVNDEKARAARRQIAMAIFHPEKDASLQLGSITGSSGNHFAADGKTKATPGGRLLEAQLNMAPRVLAAFGAASLEGRKMLLGKTTGFVRKGNPFSYI